MRGTAAIPQPPREEKQTCAENGRKEGRRREPSSTALRRTHFQQELRGNRARARPAPHFPAPPPASLPPHAPLPAPHFPQGSHGPPPPPVSASSSLPKPEGRSVRRSRGTPRHSQTPRGGPPGPPTTSEKPGHTPSFPNSPRRHPTTSEKPGTPRHSQTPRGGPPGPPRPRRSRGTPRHSQTPRGGTPRPRRSLAHPVIPKLPAEAPRAPHDLGQEAKAACDLDSEPKSGCSEGLGAGVPRAEETGTPRPGPRHGSEGPARAPTRL
ncbi:basic proline-rich protein-like [Perognathus longimembris pacificus]|uniref:basic proline-rich protein-like n=1 Tax=Perognathus longimembris pacificus TaxID=214514 RepID=UPI0020191322|nr:basic proline-rich protein-like [Perognathus longimembris pacificus]